MQDQYQVESLNTFAKLKKYGSTASNGVGN